MLSSPSMTCRAVRARRGGGGGEDGAVGQHRGRCAPRLTAAVTVSTTSRRRRWRVSGTDPEGAVLASWYDPHSGARSLRKPEALHTGTPVRFTSYAATTRMRRSRSNVFHSARESAYAAGQRHSLPPHTRKDTGSIPVGTTRSEPLAGRAQQVHNIGGLVDGRICDRSPVWAVSQLQ
jgi:hypothetical protein